MKKLVILIGLSLVLANIFSFRKATVGKDAIQESEPVAVVELFTSQGCSSCPSADKVLSRIVNDANASNKPVYALSFHVSYWNYLGWKDPYSSEEFTQRQRAYGEAFGLRSIYTPQMIVNGKDEFVGSNASKANYAVENALNKPSENTIVFKMLQKTKSEVKIDYQVDGTLEKLRLNVAVVERDLENNVPRGENRGRKLHHDNVVRNFKSVEAQKSASISIKLPSDIDLAKSSVIMYAQDEGDWSISGAAAAPLK